MGNSHLQLATRGVRSGGYYISPSLFNDVLVMTTLTFFFVRLRRRDVHGNICSTSLGVNSCVAHDSACSTFSVNSVPVDGPDSLLFEATGWSSDTCSFSALTSWAHSAGQCLRRLMETRMVSEFGQEDRLRCRKSLPHDKALCSEEQTYTLDQTWLMV